jgi:hypothetical protein
LGGHPRLGLGHCPLIGRARADPLEIGGDIGVGRDGKSAEGPAGGQGKAHHDVGRGKLGAAKIGRRAQPRLDHVPTLAPPVLDKGGRLALAHRHGQRHHVGRHEGGVGIVVPEQVVGKIRAVGRRNQPALSVSRDDIVADRAALAQYQVAIGDHRGDPHRVQRLVCVGGQAIVGAAVVKLELVVQPQFLAQPDDPFALGNPQVVDSQHGVSP